MDDRIKLDEGSNHCHLGVSEKFKVFTVNLSILELDMTCLYAKVGAYNIFFFFIMYKNNIFFFLLTINFVHHLTTFFPQNMGTHVFH